MTNDDQKPQQADTAQTPPRPTLEQLYQALSSVADWNTAGALLFDALTRAPQESEQPGADLLRAAEQCCVRLIMELGIKDIAPEVLMFPQAYRTISSFVPEKNLWTQVLLKLKSHTQENDFTWHDDIILALFVSEAVLAAPNVALDKFFKRLTHIEQLNDKTSVDLEKLGKRLVGAGWLDHEDPNFQTILANIDTRLQQLGPSTSFVVLTNVLSVLNFRDAPVWASICIAESLIFPFLARLPHTRECVDYGLWIELTVFALYLKKIDTRAHFRSTYEKLTAPLLAFGDVLLEESPSTTPVHRTGLPRIAFLFQSHANLAHSQNFITFLKGLNSLDKSPIEPIAYIIGSEQTHGKEKFPMAVLEHGVSIRWISRPPNQIGAFLTALKGQTAKDSIEAIVFVSLASFLLTSARLKIAPRVVWWAMKYHQVISDDVDGYLTYGSYGKERVIDGQKWRSVPSVLSDLYDPTLKETANKIRETYLQQGVTCILSCIGREEKINHLPFLETVRTVLDANPGTIFIWTGRSIPIEVERALDALGIADRCQFLGWVNTKVYAQVTDIYLDSFPFASGHTGYEAMAAGKPLVIMETTEAVESSTATALIPALKRETGTKEDQDDIIALYSERKDDLSYAPFVSSIEDYVAKANRLIRDEEFRKASGRAGKRFVDEYLSDTAHLARSVCDHLIDIIENTGGHTD